MFRAEQCLPTQISQGVNERLDYEQAFILLALRHVRLFPRESGLSLNPLNP